MSGTRPGVGIAVAPTVESQSIHASILATWLDFTRVGALGPPLAAFLLMALSVPYAHTALYGDSAHVMG